MIDTLTLQFNLTPQGNRFFYNSIFNGNSGILFPKSRKILKDGKCQFIGGMPPFGLFYNGNFRYINVEVCPRVILKRTPTEDDLTFIEDSIKSVIFDDLKIPKYFVENFTLNRIDYNCDKKVNDDVMEIFYNLKSKTTSKLNKVVKNERKYAISYTPIGGYSEVMTYDKYKQLLSVRYEDDYTPEELEDFNGVIRTEVRIKNRKLNYYKTDDKWGLAKDLFNYLKKDMKKYCWKKFAEKVWYSEPFYRVDVAIKMIKQNDSLTNYTKEVLCDVLRRINKYGYTRASEHFAYDKRQKQYFKAMRSGASKEELKRLKNKKLCSDDFATFRTYIAKIRNLGINPLTFDKKFKLEKIENFAKYESNTFDD